MKRKIKKIGIAILLLLAVKVGTLSTTCPDTKDTLHVSSEKMVVKAATKKQKVAAYNKKAKKAYRKFLKDVFVNGKYHLDLAKKSASEKRYAITDLNNDGKLELLLDTNPVYGNATGCIVYTYYNGKVTEAGSTYSRVGISYNGFKKGNLIYNCTDRGSIQQRFSKIKNGKLVLVARYYDDSPWTGTNGTKKFYEINGKKVTKKKFSAFLKKRIGCKSWDDLGKNTSKYKKNYKVKKYKMPTVKKVTGIKLKHQFSYEKSDYDDSYYVNDKCKVTWSKSVKGSVQIVYSTDKNFEDKTTKTIKESSKKNSFTFDTYGSTYYVKLRAYIGDKVAKSKYSKVYTFNGNDYSGSGIKKADTLYYVSVKNGKNYVCERNLTTNKESKIFSSSKSLSVVGVEGKYIYYTKGRKSDEGDVTDLYVYNMDTKQEKFMLDLVYSIDEIIDGKVFCRQDFYLMDYDTADVYSFDLDGTNKQKFLENVFTYFSYNNKIYWCEADYVEDEGTNYILRCCDMNGENKTTVTEWMFAEYPEDIEYMYSKEYVIENYIEN